MAIEVDENSSEDYRFIDNPSNKITSKEGFSNKPISKLPNSIKEIDYISKYIREDSNEIDGAANANILRDRFKTRECGTVEVFGSVGEGESHSEQNGFNNGKSYGGVSWNNRNNNNNNRGDESEFSGDEGNGDEMNVKKKISEARKEFLNEIQEDNESLTIDTCSKLTHDWKK